MKHILLIMSFYLALASSLLLANEGTPQKPPQQQYDFLIGDWDCQFQKYNAVELEYELGCFWQGKYTFDGNMVQDDFRMYSQDGKQVVFAGTTLRTYVEQKQRWDLAFLSSRNGHWPNFYGSWQQNSMHIVTKGKDAQGEFDAKIRFHNIQKDSFTWEMKKSYDQGKTWQLDSIITAKRKDVETKTAS